MWWDPTFFVDGCSAASCNFVGLAGEDESTSVYSTILSVDPRQTIPYHSNPSLCPYQNAEEAEVEWFYEDLQDLLELTPPPPPPQNVLFIIGD